MASFVIAILAGVAAITLILIAAVIEVSNPGGIGEDSPQAILMDLTFIGVIAINVLGLDLGVAGILQTDQWQKLAILWLGT